MFIIIIILFITYNLRYDRGRRNLIILRVDITDFIDPNLISITDGEKE